MALDEAIDRVQKAYGKERLHSAPTDVVAQNLGYKGANNGAAMSALASLRYYGLLERPQEGYLAVTKDFEHFKFAPDEPHRKELLVSFLRKPQLFADLLEKYENGLPSDANLRFELIQRGFSPPAAEGALVNFRRSVEYVGASAAEVEGLAHLDSPKKSQEVAEVAPLPTVELKAKGRPRLYNALLASPEITGVSNERRQGQTNELQLSGESSEEHADRIPIRLPGGRRAWLVIPTPFFEADKSRLKAQIDLLLTEDDEKPF